MCIRDRSGISHFSNSSNPFGEFEKWLLPLNKYRGVYIDILPISLFYYLLDQKTYLFILNILKISGRSRTNVLVFVDLTSSSCMSLECLLPTLLLLKFLLGIEQFS